MFVGFKVIGVQDALFINIRTPVMRTIAVAKVISLELIVGESEFTTGVCVSHSDYSTLTMSPVDLYKGDFK